MGLAVVTVAAGGTPVVETPFGTPVTEAVNKYGIAVTKVVGKPGMPVAFETIGMPPAATGVTLDPATVTAVTLSNGNLTATNTGTTGTDQGARVATSAGKATGKYYMECKLTTVVPGGGGNRGFGIGTTTSTYTAMGNGAVVGDNCYCSSGGIFANGVNTAISITGIVQGDTIGCAVDLDNRKIWFRKNTGVWNGNVANDPVTNVGGIAIPAGTMVPFVTFGGVVGTAGNAHTVNFGGSAFVGTVPAGYTAGWPA
jgi:SPRY domain